MTNEQRVRALQMAVADAAKSCGSREHIPVRAIEESFRRITGVQYSERRNFIHALRVLMSRMGHGFTRASKAGRGNEGEYCWTPPRNYRSPKDWK
jgi:hypothetical protein